MCTIIMISIVQGLYILRDDENNALRISRNRRARISNYNARQESRQQRRQAPRNEYPDGTRPEYREPINRAYTGQDQKPAYDMHELRAEEYMDPMERERTMKDEWIHRQRMEEQQRKNEEERRRVEGSGVPADLEEKIAEETERSIHW